MGITKISKLISSLKNKKIIVGITGSIAAYKTIEIIRLLKNVGAEIKVVLTKNACEFITPLTLQTISQGEVYYDMFQRNFDYPIKHIALAEWADFVLIAPATANIISKIASGIADDLLSSLVLSTKKTIALAPAMNVNMWHNPIVQENVEKLIARKINIWNPEKGELACGTVGDGRLLEPTKIVSNLSNFFYVDNVLCKKNILITAGATHELIDPVRYISNYSSGKMGYAIAEAFAAKGAKVTLISGPTNLDCSSDISKINVISALEMANVVKNEINDKDLFISVAAVADFRPKISANKKIKKHSSHENVLELVANPDILAEIAKMERKPTVIGFAAETEDLKRNALVKLREKKLDMIVANLVGKNLGFNSDFNELEAFTASKSYKLGKASKVDLASKLMQIIEDEFF